MTKQKIDLPLGGSFSEGHPAADEILEERLEHSASPETVGLPEPTLADLPVVEPQEARRRKRTSTNRRRPRQPMRLPTIPKRTRVRVVPSRNVTLAHEPEKGLYGFLWKLLGSRLYSHFGWCWLIRFSLSDRLDNALDDLWKLRTVRKAIAFVNSSGGSGKTTGATWYAAAAAFAYKGNVAVIDANENAGHTADRFGIGAKSEESQTESQTSVHETPSLGKQFLNGVGTLRLRDFVRRRHEFTGSQGHRMFLSEVDRHRQTGAFVVASNAIDDSDIDRNDLQEALRILKDNQQLVIADCGNGLKSSTNHGVVHIAETLVFVGTPFKKETLTDINSTMERYENLGYAEKVRNGFVVIFGDKPRRRKEYADRFGVPLERLIIFPVSRYMRDTESTVLLEKLPLKIQVILFESLKSIVEAEGGSDSVEGGSQP